MRAFKKVERHVSYFSNSLLRKGVTAICLEALVLLPGKIVHVALKTDGAYVSKQRKKNAPEVVFGLALPGELSRTVTVVVDYRGKRRYDPPISFFVLSLFIDSCKVRSATSWSMDPPGQCESRTFLPGAHLHHIYPSRRSPVVPQQGDSDASAFSRRGLDSGPSLIPWLCD